MFNNDAISWDELVAATKRRREMAEQLAQADQPLKIALGNGRFKVVSRDLETPGDWRITYFDERGPSGCKPIRKVHLIALWRPTEGADRACISCQFMQ